MNRKLFSALIMAGAAMAAQTASAADGTITFKGMVTDQTCVINGNGSGTKDFLVTLPTVSASSLVGQPAGRTPFSIALTGCTPASGNVHTYFESGVTTDAQTGNLILAAGGAPNVQISLLNKDTSKINVGFADAAQNSQSVAIDPATGAALLEYHAEYVAVGGVAGSGPADTSVVYTLAYN